MTDTTRMFIRIAGICSIIAPLVMLAADLLQIGGLRFEFTIVSWLTFVFFVPAIFGLTYLIAGYGSRLALLGGASAFFGAMAGASMQVLFRVWAVLAAKDSPQTIELLRGSGKLIATTQMIGIFFPLGADTRRLPLPESCRKSHCLACACGGRNFISRRSHCGFLVGVYQQRHFVNNRFRTHRTAIIFSRY